MPRLLSTIAGATLAASTIANSTTHGAVEILDAVDALPAHLVAKFEEPVAFAMATTGEYLVLDRRNHTVYKIDRAKKSLHTVLTIGGESGRVLRPAALSLAANDIFAVADAPTGVERIQYFDLNGLFIGGFYLQSRVAPRLVIGPLVLNGVGSLFFTGKTFLVNQPEHGGLFSELDTRGHPVRQIGFHRRTGYESDRDLHLALNVGIPVADPTGGFYFVFQTGVPIFRKYDSSGALIFERHIEGVELDRHIRALPTEWPRRAEGDRLPVVSPLVRTATVDRQGRLWISLIEPYTYVYDPSGEKIRTVQFRAASIIAATSLFFAGPDRLLVTPGCYEFKVN